jgi:hypothetical protein
LCTINLPNTGEASVRIIGGVALFLTGSEWENNYFIFNI